MTGPDPLVVALATEPADVAEALRVRHTVFVIEQGVPVELERDERDATADHFLARRAGQGVGAGRMVVEPVEFEDLDLRLGEVAHLGRLAVLPAERGTGLGARLVRAIERRAVDRGLLVVYLGAQTHALGFYRRLGYTEFGAEFDDAGLPHRHMFRRL